MYFTSFLSIIVEEKSDAYLRISISKKQKI